MTIAELATALYCGSSLGGICRKECKHRENGYCELNQNEISREAAEAIESLLRHTNQLSSQCIMHQETIYLQSAEIERLKH